MDADARIQSHPPPDGRSRCAGRTPWRRLSLTWLRSLCAGLAVASCSVICAADSVRVLVVVGPTEQDWGKKIRDTLQQRWSRTAAADGARRPPLDVKVVARQPGQDPELLVESLKPQLQSYGAVFATNVVTARLLQRANDHVPVVFHGDADPVQFCLADSMQRPGRNATGYVNYLPDDEFKMLEALVDGFPQTKTVYQMIADSSFYIADCGTNVPSPKPPKPPCVAGVRTFEPSLMWWQQSPAVFVHAQRLGVQVKFMMLCTAADFALIPTIEPGRNDIGFIFPFQGLYWRNAKALLAQVALSRRPAIFGRRQFVERGGLMSMEPILDADDDQAIINILLQVVDGRAPATLPIQMPRGFRLSINAAAAAAQGLRPSLALLRRADDIIVNGAAR